MQTPRQDLRLGAAFMVASALLFAGMGAAVKLLSGSLPNSMVVFARSALGLAFLAPWLLTLGGWSLRTRHLGEHAIRGLAGLAAMYFYFYAIAHMRLADAVLLNYSLPLFVPFVEHLWLGEPFPRRVWPGLLLGFAGLLVILRPGSGVFRPVALAGLAAAAFAALAQVGVRKLTRHEPVTRIVLYFSLISTLLSAGPAALEWRTPGRDLVPALLAVGLCAVLAQLFMTRAYAHAPAAQVGPFIYSAVVFAGLLDWWLWRRLPDAPFAAGALLVGVAGMLVLRSAAPPEPAAAAG